MAAAYAALVSLTHILDQILHPPPLNQIIVDRDQIECLREKVLLLLDFLENHSSRPSKDIEPDLETRIADAAYAAEDIIESNVMNQIRARSANLVVKRCYLLRQGIHKVIKICLSTDKGIPMILEKLISIEKELVKMEVNKGTDLSIEKELVKMEVNKGLEDPQPENSTTAASSSRHLPSGKNTLVGFDDHKNEIMNRLTTDEVNRQIIPIVGMGGIGKTTLAANVYGDQLIMEHFYIRAWVTISQEYTVRELLVSLLNQINSTYQNEQEMNDKALGGKVHKELFGRKYLIVMDDMWDIKVWDVVSRHLPDNNNGSRILVTTRQLNLAVDFGSCSPYKLNLLDEAQSWDLLREKIFAKEGCPHELEKIGNSIAKKCKGLPLAVVVIGGLLAKSKRTREHWLHVEEDVTSIVNNQDDDFCFKILSLSYNHLPIYLKPCYLYLAVFPEDFDIHVSRLIKLWVAEGFIKQNRLKSLEKTAEEYLEDLIHRNLILIGKRRISGEVKTLRIHDLLRDLCVRKAHKDNFLRIAKLDSSNISPHIESERHLSIHGNAWKNIIFGASRSWAPARSLLSFSWGNSTSYSARRFKLLRVLDVVDRYPVDEILQLINSRYVACMGQKLMLSSISRLWSLQTLVVDTDLTLPSEVWQMPQLRHLKARRISLPDPPDAQKDLGRIIVLENLQTLSTVQGFGCTKEVIERIPNVKKLGINCHATGENGSFCLSNLGLLRRLESLVLTFTGTGNVVFPGSLQKLILSECKIPWEDMSVVGSLPNLEVVKLLRDAAIGQEWNPIEGEFRRLKFLSIDRCELKIWRADNTHFPSLEQLHLGYVSLKEIPVDFAEILPLQVIHLNHCSSSLLESATEVSEQRENLGYDFLQVRSFPREISREDNIVGFEDEADTLINCLREESAELEVISIIGMPGLGKTTLAWMIYRDKRIEYEFPTLIWVYVSQDFNLRDVFLTILKKFTQQDMTSKTDNELVSLVRACLDKPKFILFLDDVWSAEAWNDIEAALPMSNKLGKVLITSRHERVARQANSWRKPHRLRFLDSRESWGLLHLKVFRNLEDCPTDLKLLGKEIAKNCGGVPLIIVVIGGILLSVMTSEWEKVSASVSTYYRCIVDREKRTENIIALSYNQLSHDLRDCFLYLGMFPEDTEIPAWKLIRLWIAEGFIQQKPENSLEEVAEDNLKNLINRSLIMIDKTKADGEVKTCRVHGLIHDFCKKEAARLKFLQQIERYRMDYPPVSELQECHRICIHSNVLDFLGGKPKAPQVTSFLCFSKEVITLIPEDISSITGACNLLRVLDVNPINFTEFPIKLTRLIQLRYIALSGNEFKALPKDVSDLWNLQTIRIRTMSRTFEIRANIWKMRQLRHLKTKAAIILNNKEVEGEGEGGENLQTLSRLSAHCCTEEVLGRASNLMNLGIRGQLEALMDNKCLEKLDRLQKLKLVYDVFPYVTSKTPMCGLPPPNKFPPKLRILELSATYLEWEHMSTLGKLGTLEVLKLKEYAFMGKKWRAGGGGFPSLEFLLVARTDLEFWKASTDSFPVLKSLLLRNCERLDEIPFELRESLNILDIERVSKTAVASAKKIQEAKQLMDGHQRTKRGGFKLIIAPGDT